MRPDVAAPSAPTLLDRSTVTVTLFPSSTPLELIDGSAAGGVDLTPFAESVRHTESRATLRLRHHDELAGDDAPQPGQLVQIRVGDDVAFNGVIERSASQETRGDRQINVTVRSRDGLPLWRNYRRVSELYSVGTDLGVIARDVAAAVGLDAAEYDLPDTGVPLPHDATQLTDQSAWDMLEQLLAPSLQQPFVDARGVLRAINRNVRRSADLVLPAAQAVGFSEEIARSPVTAMNVKWLGSELAKVTQEHRTIASATLTAGFFRRHVHQSVQWSADGTQRAEDVSLVIEQSVNAGLLRVGTEGLTVSSPYGGQVFINVDDFDLALATAGLAALLLANNIPEDTLRGIAKSAAELVMWTAIMRVGVGVYQIKGTLYDYVQTVNEVEAYDSNAADWAQNIEELQNDLIPSESVAEALAINELIYRSRSARTGTVTIADDLRLEPGDIVELPDLRRFYVTEYERDLTRGADPTMDLGGFFIT